MKEYNGLEAIELFEQRTKLWFTGITSAIVRHHYNALSIEAAESIVDFVEARFHVGQSQAGEKSETSREIALHLGCIFIAGSGDAARFLEITEPYAWRRN